MSVHGPRFDRPHGPPPASLPPASLPLASPDEFFPSASRWSRIGGALLFVAFAALVLLAGVLRFNVTVRADAAIRPAGELRVVQAKAEGTIAEILVAEDQVVEAGDVLAIVDDASLRREHRRLREARDNAALQNQQMRDELTALDRRLAANAEQLRAEVDFERDKLERNRKLAEQGVVSEIDVRVLERNLSSLEAKLRGAGAAGEREQLRQRMTQNLTVLENFEAELSQLESDIASAVIRAPAPGVIQELTLRNPGQIVRAGDLVARIAPPNDSVRIKALVAIRDIGRVDVGQRVHVRVSACPYTDYGTLKGTVTTISPDALAAQDASRIYGGTAVAGATGYEVTAQPDALVLGDNAEPCEIQAGMEGRADIVSREETVLKFLLRKARLTADI